MIFTYYNILKQITLLHNTTIKYFAFVALVLSLILISDKKWTKICEDIFRKTRRRTPQGCRLAKTTTKYCGKQTAKIVYFLFEFSIRSSRY